VRFVEESYDKHNDWAIAKVSEYLEHRGYTIVKKEKEDYGIDIKAERNGETIYVEAEAKEDYPWTDLDSFKFSTVSFLGRKKKWAEHKFWYVIICRESEAMLVGHSDVIFQDQYIEKIHINKGKRKGGDTFYRVPKELLVFINKKDDGYAVTYRP
jgi:hypothetical protein